MKTFDTLYARNSNGKINQWGIGVQDDGPKVIIWEGLLDGQLTRTERSCKAKNIGKMNETSAYEQGCKDAQSRWEKKKQKGYKSLNHLKINTSSTNSHYYIEDESNDGATGFSTIDLALDFALPKNRTDSNDLNKPMLASPMFDSKTGKSKAKFPMYGQPKLNGFRMMCRWEKVMEGEGMFTTEVEKPVFRSREGIRFDTLQHIESYLTKEMFFIDGKEIVLDGELYVHGWLLQRINSAVNKKNNDTCLLKFYIFDLAIEDIKQDSRFDLIYNSKLITEVTDTIESVKVHDLSEANHYTEAWINAGYEGGIFREIKGLYQFGKRNSTMLKLKRFQDKEFLVLDVIGGDNAPTLGVFVCQAENGKAFKCNPQGTHEVKAEYLTNKDKYIGKKLTVKFYERTADGIPFHTTGIAIRDYE